MLTAFNSTLSTARQRHPVIVPQLWTSLTHICFRPPSAASHCHHTNTHHSLCSQGYSRVYLYTVKPSSFFVTKLLYKESIQVSFINKIQYLSIKCVIHVCWFWEREIICNNLKMNWGWKSIASGWRWQHLVSSHTLQNSLRQNISFSTFHHLCVASIPEFNSHVFGTFYVTNHSEIHTNVKSFSVKLTLPRSKCAPCAEKIRHNGKAVTVREFSILRVKHWPWGHSKSLLEKATVCDVLGNAGVTLIMVAQHSCAYNNEPVG